MRLNAATLDCLSPAVKRPSRGRDETSGGIVHLGVGAFHRAHQAIYTQAANAAAGEDWAITGVALRSPDAADRLEPQDGLYTVTERGGGQDRVTLVDTIRAVVTAPRAPAAVAAALADPATHVVTLTVTEKGYCRSADGQVDAAAAAAAGGTIYHHLARAVVDRQAAGLGPLTLVSCDNLAGNGAVLRNGLLQFLDRVAPRQRAWFQAEWCCPATMVDRIVPATTAADLDRVAATIGLRDEAAVVTEPFRQWVIEDRFAGPRPRWDLAGAQFVPDARPYEMAKLRLLNGAHSALAYLGLARGHRFVHEAIADAAIRPLIERLMRDEAAASLPAGLVIGLATYPDRLLARFANAALPHALAQIATDGSQKIGARWLDPLVENRARSRASPATLAALAAWLTFVREPHSASPDPIADVLADQWRRAGAAGVADALFAPGGLFGGRWMIDPIDLEALKVLLVG